MGYFDYGWNGHLEIRVDPGPNQKNELKLALMRYRKEYGTTHTIEVKKVKYRNQRDDGFTYEDVIIGTPTPEFLSKQKAERELQDEEYQDNNQEIIPCPSLWRRQGKRKRKKGPRNHPGWGPQELSEEDLLEVKASKPRCRYQRGWKERYLPTEKTWRRHNDLRSWKRYTKRRKAWDK